jgi:hypothetical protein
VKLSDNDWHTVLKAVGPLPKGAKLGRARRELTKCLRRYPGLRLDRAKLRAALLRWQQIDKLATDLYAMLAEEWRQKRWRYNPLIDDAFKRHLLRSTKVIIHTRAMQSRLRKGKLDPDRDWLYLSLLDIWINQFRGELRASSGATGGPCVRFIRTAMALVIPADEVPSVPTVRRIVRALRHGQALEQFRYNAVVVGAQRPWRR